MTVKVEDNFLLPIQFKKLQEWFMNDCLWMYCDHVVDHDVDHPDDFQFMHLFWYPNRGVVSDNMNIIAPILDKLDPSVWVRIKANCRLKTDKVRVGGMHTDVGDYGHTTSIFYINSNDGRTTFENGDRYNSIENRMITFPSHLKHAGSTPSNAKARFVINFNYFQ
jgi:hypothetical protein|tara:strand:- start:1 stop:495 length:495 start_codon:yes stop_codon:yes gene_type:complete